MALQDEIYEGSSKDQKTERPNLTVILKGSSFRCFVFTLFVWVSIHTAKTRSLQTMPRRHSGQTLMLLLMLLVSAAAQPSLVEDTVAGVHALDHHPATTGCCNDRLLTTAQLLAESEAQNEALRRDSETQIEALRKSCGAIGQPVAIVSQPVRRLQQASRNCTGNAGAQPDVSCAGGSVLVANATATAGADAATCCTCPDGTTTPYADEALAFRFQADGITRDGDGSLVWNAAAPGELAFVMNRTIVSGSTNPAETQDPALFPANKPWIEPTVAMTGGAPSGLQFSPSAGCPNPCLAGLFANQSVAFGAAHTFFAVLTPAPGTPNLVETIVQFSPGAFEEGLVAWYVGNAWTNPDERTFFLDTWGGHGFNGPVVQHSVRQLLVARSHYGADATGGLGPVAEFAVLDLSSPAATPRAIVWSGAMYGKGLIQYDFEQTARYDHDFRDPAVDGKRVAGAGYMILGMSATAYASYHQYRGAIHHLELHSATLSTAHVADIVVKLRHAVAGGAPLSACHNCPPGAQDSDGEPATPCEPCGRGTFSAQAAQTECTGTCAVGNTVRSLGATSNAACSRCVPGQYGSVASEIAVCQPCEAGRASTAVGATSGASCSACSPGKFSVSGSVGCKPSGCTDEWGENYKASAQVDEGACVYTCSRLRERTGADANTPGGCCIYEVGLGWRRYAFNNAPLPGGAIAEVPYGESWVIQGRPLAGSTREAPLHSAYVAKTLEFKAVAGAPEGSLTTVRYTAHSHNQAGAGGDGAALMSLASGAVLQPVRLAHVVVADNIQTSQPALLIDTPDFHASDVVFIRNRNSGAVSTPRIYSLCGPDL